QLRREGVEFLVTIDGAIRPDPDLELTPIGRIHGGGVYCRPGHPLAQREQPSSTELLQYPFAVAGIEAPLEHTHRALLNVDETAALDFRVICDNLFVLQRVVALTDTLLITSRGAMTELVAAGTFIELPIARST